MLATVLRAKISSFFNVFNGILTIIKFNFRTALLDEFLYLCFINIILRSFNINLLSLQELRLLNIKLILWFVLINILLFGRHELSIKILIGELLRRIRLENLWLGRRHQCLSSLRSHLFELIHHFIHIRNFGLDIYRWLLDELVLFFFLGVYLSNLLKNLSFPCVFRILGIPSLGLLSIFQSFHNKSSFQYTIFSLFFPVSLFISISKQR